MKFRIDPITLGKMLSQLRQKSGLSQAKISKACEVNSPQYISNIERGQCLPSLKIFKTMLSEYNVTDEDKESLIKLFITSAKEEIEDLFSVDLNLKHSATNKDKPSYIEDNTVHYTMIAKSNSGYY